MGRGGMLTAAEEAAIWRHRKAGRSLSEIGRDLGRAVGSVFSVIGATGGIPPRERRKSRLALSLPEREEISRLLAMGQSFQAIARQLGRSASTVSREVGRNQGRIKYRAAAAEQRHWRRTRRPQACALAKNRALRAKVDEKLRCEWSPQQISAWLKLEYAGDANMQISHETIYKSLFIQARGALKKELTRHLRKPRAARRNKNSTATGQGRGQIVGAISIRDRPAEVEDRAVPGHWEGDLIVGSQNSYIATLVERRSRFVMLVKIDSKDSEHVAKALENHVKSLPKSLMRSLTLDRGAEFAAHAKFSMATGVAVYFCDPKSPWQRGSNENTNGLLRQYFPKGTSLAGYTQKQLDLVSDRLNTRPRMTLGFKTPAAILAQAVASTA